MHRAFEPALMAEGHVHADGSTHHHHDHHDHGAERRALVATTVKAAAPFAAGSAAAASAKAAALADGVLKAMLSGIAAAHLIEGVLAGKLPAANAATIYQSWLTEWFTNDAAHLSAFYRDIRVCGFDPSPRLWRGRGVW